MKLNNNYYRREGDVFNATIYHYLQYTVLCNEFKAWCIGWSGLHFFVTVIRSVSVGIISFIAFKAMVIQFYTILATCILQQVLKNFVGAMLVVVVLVVLVVLFLCYIWESTSSVPFVLQVS